ncbi:MAG TPA: hypothetical protein VGA85_04765 [Dehalococcoidales bacterium]
MVPNRGIPAKAFHHDADLFLSAGLAAGKALDILDELSGLLSSGFSLLEVVCGLLHHGSFLPLNHNLLVYQYWSKPISVY